MKVLVTGANGLLGGNLIRELIDRGHKVCVFIMPNSCTKTLSGLPVEIRSGNILEYAQLKSACQNMDAIFHLAANTSVWPSRDKKVVAVNVNGTLNVLRAVMETGIKKLIHVGTANTFTYGALECPGDETSGYGCKKYRLDYMDSKYKAQKLVLEAVAKGLPGVIVNPTFMIGPYDSTPSSGQMLIAVHSKKVRAFAPGGKNFICAKDAAVGIANALTMGRIGESYIIGHQNLSYKEAFEKMALIANVAAPRFRMPKWAVIAFGAANSTVAKLFGKAPLVSYTLSRISCDRHYYSAAKAVRELALPQTPIEVGIRESFEWLKSNNYLQNAK